MALKRKHSETTQAQALKPGEPEWQRLMNRRYDTGKENFEKNSTFMKVESSTSESLSIPHLHGGKLPLFDMNLSKEIEKDDIPAMEQSCLLASRWITSGLLIPFFHSIIYAGMRRKVWTDNKGKLNDGTGTFGHEYLPEVFDPRRKIDQAEYDTVCTVLLHVLPNYITYDYTPREYGEGGYAIPQEKCAKGRWSSVIHLSVQTIDDLKEAENNSEDVPLLLSLRFQLAITLVHELAHAVMMYSEGDAFLKWTHEKHKFEPFFGPDLVSETGFELERNLFDGHLTRLWGSDNNTKVYRHDNRLSALKGIWVLWDWPYQGIVDEYRAEGGEVLFGVRYEPKRFRALDRAWRVGLPFIQKFFSETFWAQTIASPSIFAKLSNCHPERRTGYYFRSLIASKGEGLGDYAHIQPVKSAPRRDFYQPKDYEWNKRTGDLYPVDEKSKLLMFQTVSRYVRFAERANTNVRLPWKYLFEEELKTYDPTKTDHSEGGVRDTDAMDIDSSPPNTATDLAETDADKETTRSSSEDAADRPLAYYDNGDPIYPDQPSTGQTILNSRSSHPDIFSSPPTGVAPDGLPIYPRTALRPFDPTAPVAATEDDTESSSVEDDETRPAKKRKF